MKFSETRIGQKVLAISPFRKNWELARIVWKGHSVNCGNVLTIEFEDGETYTYSRHRGEPFPWLQKPQKVNA